MRKFIVIGILLLNCMLLRANTAIEMDSTSQKVDSVQMHALKLEMADALAVKKQSGFNKVIGDITQSKAYKMTNIAIPLIAGGLIVQGTDIEFRNLRNEFVPQFNAKYDDYLQYLPAAAMLGLKLGGVKGRSSWTRMLVSDAFSVLLVTASVNSIKRMAKQIRPDGSNNHSFPSGHTATAFMCATMLHKEYGKVSPWYSIGGYAVATATGVSRILNNKHWLSDVMVGAGIGILSTELGYFFADLIFKKKGLNEFAEDIPYDRTYKPSYVGIYMGFNVSPSSIQLQDGKTLELNTGANAGFEGAAFFNPYIGVGGRVNVSSMPIKSEKEMLGMTTASVGPYFSYPICSQILVGAKILGGYAGYNKTELSSATIGGNGGASLSTGLTVTIIGSKKYNLKFFADYNLQNSVSQTTNKSLQYVTIGSVGAINF